MYPDVRWLSSASWSVISITVRLFPLAGLIAAIAGLLSIRPIMRVVRYLRGRCISCGYLLSHLPTPRCPECGLDSLTRRFPAGATGTEDLLGGERPGGLRHRRIAGTGWIVLIISGLATALAFVCFLLKQSPTSESDLRSRILVPDPCSPSDRKELERLIGSYDGIVPLVDEARGLDVVAALGDKARELESALGRLSKCGSEVERARVNSAKLAARAYIESSRFAESQSDYRLVLDKAIAVCDDARSVFGVKDEADWGYYLCRAHFLRNDENDLALAEDYCQCARQADPHNLNNILALATVSALKGNVLQAHELLKSTLAQVNASAGPGENQDARSLAQLRRMYATVEAALSGNGAIPLGALTAFWFGNWPIPEDSRAVLTAARFFLLMGNYRQACEWGRGAHAQRRSTDPRPWRVIALALLGQVLDEKPENLTRHPERFCYMRNNACQGTVAELYGNALRAAECTIQFGDRHPAIYFARSILLSMGAKADGESSSVAAQRDFEEGLRLLAEMKWSDVETSGDTGHFVQRLSFNADYDMLWFDTWSELTKLCRIAESYLPSSGRCP